MSSYDTPEQIDARRTVFSRFNRLRMIQEEKSRSTLAQPRDVTCEDLHKDPWAATMVTDVYCQQQLEYAKPYLKEYERGGSEVDLERKQPDSQVPEGQDDNDDTKSATSASSRQSTLISRLASLRGRTRNISSRALSNCSNLDNSRPTRRSPVSVCATQDFDITSTIIPPTEVLSRPELTSNIRAIDLRNDYFSGYRCNTKLPIYHHRSHIINSISSYSVVIIEGSTGCGKTTQVPLYILEDTILERPAGQAPVIYVTQPRRIAARSIAERVCNEHNWSLGSIVGYQVGLEKIAGPQTVLIFCTAGVLLQKIIQERSLKNYSHIIIDEAHERDADTDLLLMMIRKLMLTETPIFRLIIMSATMDIEKLRSYYTFRTTYGHEAMTVPSVVKIGDIKSPNDVQIVYYDKFNHLFDLKEPMPEIDLENPELLDSCLRTAVKIIVDVIPHLDNYTEASKSTLVFLPGLAEISKLDRMIRACPGADDHLDIIPLHSCLTSDDQSKVFKPSKPGYRKVILATNIAESSITVTDIGFIVDFCLTKVLMKDNITRFPTLKLVWSTQDKCTQRAGRTGRCCPGKVFRLVSFATYRQLNLYAEPELLVAPLELSVLRVKNFNMGEIQGLFAVVLDPPPYEEIRTAVLELKQIGALSSTYMGKLSDIDGELTSLGKVIAALPIDVHLSKLIVIAQVFDVLESAIIVAACLSTNRTIVKHMYQDPLETYDRKLEWAHGSYSDLFVCLDVYREFEEQVNRGKQDRWIETWCKKKALDDRKLQDVLALVGEIKLRLEQLNIAVVEQPNRERKQDEDSLMLKVAFCAAFYPNYFLTDKLDQDNVVKYLAGLDARRTVTMHNLPVNQVPLFRSRIEAPIKTYIGSDFDFIADNSRALLVFRDTDHLCPDEQTASAIGVDGIIEPTSGIPISMYRALKLGENLELNVREFKEEAARERMSFYNLYRTNIQSQFGNRLAPSLMKLVDCEPDNSHLLNASETDYYHKMNGFEFYLEVPFNSEQDLADRQALNKYENTNWFPEGKMYEEHEDPIFKDTIHRIRGPESPIRLRFRSVLVKSRGFSVEIDPNSINSILLDPDYEKDRRQMLVAATVAQNKRNKVLARDTTLLPNIRGLPTLMALLFAQYYRLVYNTKIGCIAGAIFGLGWDENDQPLDRMYEVDLGFDVHITQDDIDLINEARQRISDLLKNDVQNAGRPRATIQVQLRDIILTLMRKRRYPIQELDVSFVDFPTEDGERIFVKDRHNLPVNNANPSDESQQETKPFLPLMEKTRTLIETDLYDSIRANLIQLNNIAQRKEKIPHGGIKCLLCGNGFRCFMVMYHALLEHLEDERHNAMLEEFEVFEKRARALRLDTTE